MKAVHLLIDEGPEKGREIHIAGESVRIGRSSKNDIVIDDASLSRFHCRLGFRPDAGLWLTDLGSSNHTMVNDTATQEARLRAGDRVRIGDTVLRVVSDRPEGGAAPAAAPAAAAPAHVEEPVELGLRPETIAPPVATAGPGGRFRLVLFAVVTLAVVLGAGLLLLIPSGPPPDLPPPAPARVEEPESVAFSYEKVHARPDNIFRYEFTLSESGVLAIQIDDIVNSQHLRKEKTVAPAVARSLARAVENAGFFGLEADYQGIQPVDHDLWDVTVTIGHRTHRTRVMNRLEPDTFRAARELIEEFGKNELGLHAVALPPEKLIEMAQDAHQMGQKLYGERGIRPDNLARALKYFSEAEWYLESIEPKPAFYPGVIASRRDAEQALQTTYEERLFLANKASRNREWQKAHDELAVICEMIPDRGDRRYIDAYKQLLDVQRHLEN